MGAMKATMVRENESPTNAMLPMLTAKLRPSTTATARGVLCEMLVNRSS